MMSDEPNAAATFMASLSSSSRQFNEVRTFNDNIFETVSEVPQDEHLDSDEDSVHEDNTIPYDQYLATKEKGHRKVNQEQILVNATLSAELDQCKLELARLERNKVKLECDKVIVACNKRNAKLEQETELLQTTIRNKEATIASLTSETKTVLFEKKTLEDKYLEEIVCLKNANQVATGLGFSSPWYSKKVQLAQPTLYDGHRLLQPGHASFVPQKELPREQVYWLSASDIASQSSDPSKPVTPFVHTRPVNSEEFERIFDELDSEYEQTVLANKTLQIEKKNLLIKNECLISDSISKDICSIVLTSVNIVPPISDCMCAELRTSCDREHNRVLKLEAEISKLHNMLKESVKRCVFIQKDHIDLQVKFQKFKECANSNATPSNAIFKINKLKDQLQERDETIRNLESKFNVSRMLKIGSLVGSLDKNALETEITQLKDNTTSLRIQNDGYKIEIANHTRRYLELSKAITHSRNTSNEKITALNAEIAKMKPNGSGTKVSGPKTPEKPKVLAPGMYAIKRSRLSHTSVNNGNSKESFNKQTTLLEKRMDESIPLDKKCQSSIEIFKVKTYVNTIITGVELCKEKIANRTYSGYIDPFIQNTIEAKFSPVITRINAGLQQFHKCLNEEMVADLRYFNSLEIEVDSLRSQLRTQKT
uniref:Uncharacterized protein n=1 Tax=Tanacetum cinerariifolium TaxID=118510 RepID=A0A6L2N048_TANCI|nr:hypothetical protein [Tanacetum cinerariifolium]